MSTLWEEPGPPQPDERHRHARKRRKVPWLIAGAVGVVVLATVFAVASGGDEKKNVTTATASTAQASPKKTARPTNVRILRMTGSGIKKSKVFTAPETWTFAYEFDCGAQQGNFIAMLYSQSIPEIPVDVLVNRLDPKGRDSTQVHHDGKVWVEVNSTCTWTVTGTRKA